MGVDIAPQRPHARRPQLAVVVFAALVALALVPAPSFAVRRPHGPKLVTPAPATTLTTSKVAFHWKNMTGAARFDLRLARNRSFSSGLQTIAVGRTGATVTLAKGAWYWKVRSHGRIASRWSNTRMVRVRPAKDVFPPSRPGALRVTAETDTTATLGFVAAKDDIGVTGYRVLANGVTRLADATTTAPAVTGLACATLYTFTVVAFDAAGNVSKPSPPAHMRTRACSATSAAVVPLAVPVGLTATTVTDSTVALTWSGGGGAAGFAVYRNGVLLGKPTSAGFLATSLAAATPYTFTVRARDRAGNLTTDSVPLTVSTVPPLPATGDAYAFLLATVDSSFRDLQAHYQQIGTISPTYFEVMRNGSISGQDDPLVTRWARLHGVRVEPRFHSEDPTTLHQILSSPTASAALAANIASIAALNGYDGADIDFEGDTATDRDALTAFAQTLAGLLHGQGETLTMAVGAKTSAATTGRNGFYDYPALAQTADHLFAMAWDLHWSTSPAGPISDVTWVSKVVAYIKTVPNSSRFILGTQLYGFDWPLGGKATPLEFDGIQSLLAQVGATPAWDQVAQEPYFTYTDPTNTQHTVYYANAPSVDARYAVARANGLGIGMWRLGTEDQTMWNDPTLQP
jgi:spore germination protein YaaH